MKKMSNFAPATMNIWMFVFLVLPLAALAYIGWHTWCLLPLPNVWRALVVVLMVSCFLLLFYGIRRTTDSMPMPLAVGVYEVGTSSLIVLLYVFMVFLLLDIGRLVHLFPPLGGLSPHAAVKQK